MSEQAKLNWVSVLNFLQTEYTQSSVREKEWLYEKQMMNQKIATLESELKSNLIICETLVSRIKILEMALKEEKRNKGQTKPTLTDEHINSIIQKYKLKENLSKNSHEEFLNEIIKDMRIETDVFKRVEREEIQEIPKINKTHKIVQKKKFGAHLDVVTIVHPFQLNKEKLIATSSEDCLIKIWKMSSILKEDNPQPKHTLRKHTGPLFSLTACKNPNNSNQTVLFSGGIEGDIKSWKIENDNAKWTGNWLNGNEQEQTIWQLQALEDKLLSSSSDGVTRLFKIGGSEQLQLSPLRDFKEKSFNHSTIKWVNNNLFLAACSNAPRLHLWNIEGQQTGKFIYEIQKNREMAGMVINSLAINNQRKFILTGCQDTHLRLFDLNSGKAIKKLQAKGSICSVLSWQDKIISGDHKGSINIWDERTFNLLQSKENVHLQKYDTGLTHLAQSEKYMFSSGGDGVVKVYELTS